MMCSALLETDRGCAVRGCFRGDLTIFLSDMIVLCPSDRGPDRWEEKFVRMDPSFLAALVKSGWIMGIFPITTATNVSRTAQLPASWAPLAPP